MDHLGPRAEQTVGLARLGHGVSPSPVTPAHNWGLGPRSLLDAAKVGSVAQADLSSPRAEMSKEVAGEGEGVTLLECIADGRVPQPERMSLSKWQEEG